MRVIFLFCCFFAQSYLFADWKIVSTDEFEYYLSDPNSISISMNSNLGHNLYSFLRNDLFDTKVDTGNENVGSIIITSDSSNSADYAISYCPLGKDNENEEPTWKPFRNVEIPNYFKRREDYLTKKNKISLKELLALISQKRTVILNANYFNDVQKIFLAALLNEERSINENISFGLEILNISDEICKFQGKNIVIVGINDASKNKVVGHFCQRMNQMISTNGDRTQSLIQFLQKNQIINHSILQNNYQLLYQNSAGKILNPMIKKRIFKELYNKCLREIDSNLQEQYL